jgi:hypothetical protein
LTPEEIKKISPKYGDIVLFRFSKDIQQTDIVEKMKTIKQVIPNGVGLIALFGDVDISCVNEEYMNSMGWKKIRGKK